MKILILLIFIWTCNLAAQNAWQKLNGPLGGEVTAFSIKGDTIVIGVGAKGKLFYSTNNGNNWNDIKIKLNAAFIDIISADSNLFFAVSHQNGIYKSSDLLNWTKVFSNNLDFWSLGKDNYGILFAGTDNGYIYYSSDYGTNWNLAFNNYTDRIVRFLTLKSGQMFAGAIGRLFKKDLNNPTWSPVIVDTAIGFIRPFSDENDNIYFLSYPKIYESTDIGNSWSSKDNRSFFYNNDLYDCIYNNRMIAAMGDMTYWPSGGWGMALSDDKGITWRWNNNGMPPKFSSSDRLAKSGNDTYIGTDAAGVYKSTNFGDNWFSVNIGITAADTWVINFDNEGSLYSACWSNGIYKSIDKGLSWIGINNGFTNTYVNSVFSDNDGILLTSTEEGTYRSTDKGINWTQLDNKFFYYFFIDNTNRIYGLNYGNGLYRSTDHGNSWTKLDNGFINGYVFGFAIDSSNDLYAGISNGVIYKSTNDGLTWTNVYQSSNSNSVISYIAIAPNGNIFASNIYEGILRSTDNGSTWQLKKTDAGYQDVYPLGITKKGVIYTSGSNSTFYSSTDNGNTWNDVTSNLSLTTVRDIKFDKDDNIYLATDESVWTNSTNPLPIEITNFTANANGNNVTLKWNTSTEVNNSGFYIERKFTESTPWQSITFIKGAGSSSKPNKYSYTNSNVSPGKYNYRLKQIDINGQHKYYSLQNEVVVNDPSVFSLEQNYPNPFNPSTTIKYSLPTNQHVTIKVYDILGKEISTLVNEEKLSGEYAVNFDGHNLASGVYIYRISAGTFTQVRKMQLIK